MRVVVAVGPAPSLRLLEMGVAAVVGGGGGAERLAGSKRGEPPPVKGIGFDDGFGCALSPR